MKFTNEELDLLVKKVEKWSKEKYSEGIKIEVRYDEQMVIPNVFIDYIKRYDLHITDMGMNDINNYIEYVEYEIETSIKTVLHNYFLNERI